MSKEITEIQTYLAQDISLSFWPAQPKKILIIGRRSISFANAIYDEIPGAHVDVIFYGHNEEIEAAHTRGINFIMPDEISSIPDSTYDISLMSDKLSLLHRRIQIFILYTAKRLLNETGRVIAVEDNTSSFDFLKETAVSLGFYGSFVSAVENSSLAVVVVKKAGNI
jgi:hypothetical protein